MDPLALAVATIRFVRCFLEEEDRMSAVQVGIALTCHSLISLTMYFFVFEIKAVVNQLKAKDGYDYKIMEKPRKFMKTLIMSAGAVYTVLYTVIRVQMALDDHIPVAEEVLYILTLSSNPY
jgi:hypothetical protein